MLPASGKFGLNRYVTSSGDLGVFDVDETQTAKFIVNNASPSNIFTIKGRIQGQSNYVPIDTIIGSVTKTIDITQYDYIQVECTSYASLSTYVQIDGSGFATSLVDSPIGNINLSVSLIPSEDGVHIADKTTGYPLKVNADGSINVTGSFTGGGDASAANQVTQIDQLNDILTELQTKTKPSDVQNISNLDHSKDSVSSYTKDGLGNAITSTNISSKNAMDVNVANTVLAKLDSTTLTSLQTIQDTSNTILTQIENNTVGLATESTQADVLSALQDINNAQLILNTKEQIMRAVDREQDIVYADFGTKDQRITQISYSASSVGVFSAVKTISYTLVGSKYRLDSITWSII